MPSTWSQFVTKTDQGLLLGSRQTEEAGGIDSDWLHAMRMVGGTVGLGRHAGNRVGELHAQHRAVMTKRLAL